MQSPRQWKRIPTPGTQRHSTWLIPARPDFASTHLAEMHGRTLTGWVRGLGGARSLGGQGPPLFDGDNIYISPCHPVEPSCPVVSRGRVDLGKIYNATDIEIYFGWRAQAGLAGLGCHDGSERNILRQ